MKYEDVIECIENKRRFGNKPGVIISQELLSALGNPQNELKFVHIAGTNGKGSTAAFLSSVLNAAGIRTGMFTSPHLISFTERIQINGNQIPKEEAASIGEMLLQLKLEGQATMFDYCLAMALLYFKKEQCELVVLETGMGGRLDSTNVIDAPLVSIITKIGYDHTNVLGNTLAEIAAEKAGILKQGSYAVIETQDEAALEVLTDVCQKKCISYQIADVTDLQDDTYFSQMHMKGKFQKENAYAAILAAKELKRQGYDITENAIRKGISKAIWQGRMEIMSKEPFLLIDGAHNGHGVKALVESLKELYPDEKFHFIMGVLADKDYEEMADLILPLAQDAVTVTPESSRALQGVQLAEYIAGKGITARYEEKIEAVFEPFIHKQDSCGIKGKTIAFGSLYFIGDIRKLFLLSV